MKLFRKEKKTDRLAHLINNLEKITKITLMRIDKDYTNSVTQDLKWLEESFILVLKTSETNLPLFLTLIDPNRKYRKISFESLDNEDFSFSMWKAASPASSNIDQSKFRKLYENFDELDNTDDLILKYMQCVFSIWDAAITKNNAIVQKYVIYIYTNWMYILERQESEAVDFQRMLKFFIDQFGYFTFTLLDIDDKKQNPSLNTVCYGIYLNKIFSDDIKFENLGIYFQFLFDNIYKAVKLEKYEIINQFIERCINSNFDPFNYGAYSELYEVLNRKLKETGYNDNQLLLKKIPELGFYRLRYLKDNAEYEEWAIALDVYLASQIFTKIEADDEINSLVEAQKRLALKCLKYNLLQLTVIKILIYTLFKSEHKNIKHAFEFNQPADSNAIQGNKEIMPTGLLEILNYLEHSYDIENELFKYWEGHHGVEYYIHIFFIYTFYRYNAQKPYYTEDPDKLIKSFCLDILLNDPGKIDALKNKMERLRSTFQHLIKQEKRTDLFVDEKRISETIELFDLIIRSTAQAIEQVEKSNIIPQTTKVRFTQKVIQEYKKYNFMLQLFKLYEDDNLKAESQGDYFGVNELMDRSAFLENWHIPYVGVIESFGKTIAELETRLGYYALYATITEERKASQLDLLSKIDKHISKDHIIVGKNIYFYSVFRDVEGFVEVTDNQSLIKNCHVGNYHGMPVFNFYDQGISDKNVLIINKKDLGGVIESTVDDDDLSIQDQFSVAFLDYLEDADKFHAFIENSNSWLTETFGDDKGKIKNYLEKFVWIRILKGADFIIYPQKNGILYQIN